MVPEINLLPPRQKKTTPKILLLYAILAIILIVIIALFIHFYFSSQSTIKEMQQKIPTLEAEVTENQAALDVITANQAASIDQVIAFVHKVSYPATPLITETQRVLPQNTYLRSYNFKELTVELSLDFETMADVATYVEQLQTSSFFSDIQVTDVSNFDVADNDDKKEDELKRRFKVMPRYSATITCKIDYTYVAGGYSQ